MLERLEPRLLLSAAPGGQAIELFGSAQAVFAENRGQWSDESIRYAFDGERANVLFTDSGPVFQLFDGETPAQFAAQFDGANSVSPVGLEQTRTVFNYHIGDEAAWRDEVATYASIAYMNLYDGIDLHTRGRRDNLKYEFRAAPGADFSQISISYTGVDALEVDPTGALRVSLADGWRQLVDKAPYIYQIIDGAKVEVAGSYRVIDADTYGFDITGDYDPTRALVIDPELDWSTYIGGTSGDRAYGAASDSAGNALVAGYTWSRGLSGGWDPSFNGGGDAFAAKISTTGEHLWSTYLGGSSGEYGYGIAADADGNVLITGRTQSSGWVSGGWLSTLDGSSDGFVVKLNSSGGHVWSSYVGGGSWDEGHAVAADAAGNVLVTGSSESSGWVSGGWNTSYSGGRDVFALKLSAAGAHVWSTYIGGSLDDRSYGIAADASGNALVTGYTYSDGWVSGGWRETHGGGGGDAFVVKLSNVGGHVWSSYLGGSSSDYGYAVAADSGGNALVTGYTLSDDWISGGADTVYNGDGDVFVAKLDTAGGYLWSSYVGGSSSDYGYGVATDSGGNVLVAGYTESEDWASSGADTSYGGASDGFAAKFTASGGHLWSTYIGGSGVDGARGIAVTANGDALVTGETESADWISGGYDTSHNGFVDAFAARLTGVVTIADPGLEQAIRDATNRPSGDLTDDDLAALTSLDASSRNISSLEGLQLCTNLTDLDLSGNQLIDLQDLADSNVLGAGDTLNVTDNPLNSVAFITNIPALEALGVTVDYLLPVGVIPDLVGRRLFRNSSAPDGEAPLAGDDDNPIATETIPLLAGGLPGPVNHTSYAGGITGIMMDFNWLFKTPRAEDFRVRVTDASGAWVSGPTPTVNVRPIQGADDTDRVTLTWAGGTIVNQWIEVTVLSAGDSGSLGLTDNSVFYFGSAVGDADGDGQVASADFASLKSQLGLTGDNLTADFDRNGRVDLADFAVMRGAFGNVVAAAPILTGDIDQSGQVDGEDYSALRGQLGLTGSELAADFNCDGRVDLADFAILRTRFGDTLAAPEPAAAAPSVESATTPEAPSAPLADEPIDKNDTKSASDDTVTALTPATAEDMLSESPSPDAYIPQADSPEPTPELAAATEYDLKPLSDEPPADSEIDDPLADILIESPLALQL